MHLIPSTIWFTVIITCYNRETCIKRAIESVTNQTHQQFEIIVVDDASTDNSINEITPLLTERIKLIKHERNRGQNAALNTALKAASHPYIAFLDSDDIFLPDCLATYANIYAEFPHIGFAYGRLEGGPKWELEGNSAYAQALNQGYISCLITLTAPKASLAAVGNFDERYTICQDDDICMRLAKRYAFKHIPSPVARTIGVGDGMTLNKEKLANGWEFFFHDYKSDIIEYCGYNSWGKHMYKLSLLYLDANKYSKFFKYYMYSLLLLKVSVNRFPPPVKFNYRLIFKVLGSLTTART